uniref:Uncharacterized protein n=1 Tax=Panagrolaimus superbus TaxID=310955 RepID=A0A914Z994_9BILA
MESDSTKTSTTELSDDDIHKDDTVEVVVTNEEDPTISLENCPDTITRPQSLPVIIEDTSEQEEGKFPKLSISSQNMDLWNNDLTLEALPDINNYRLTIQTNTRPSMPELIHGLSSKKHLSTIDIQNGRIPSADSRRGGDLEGGYESYDLQPKKLPKLQKPLGWFSGVYIPSFTNIVGTLLYLRMGYVAGQAGISVGIGIVLFSTFVIAITALSLTGICSNGKIKKGGLYYVVSRALGPQLGGCIGFIFSLANIGMAALYIVGIAEFISDLLREAGYDYVTFNEVWDNRVFSLGICAILMLIAFAGPNIENSFTYFFFSTYFISYVNWVIGTFMPVIEEQSVRGVTGYSMATLKANLYPDYRGGENVVSVFAVFFPGFTGMLASTMYVEQLSDPGADVAKGLFASIGSTAIMYIYAVFAAGATIVRDADGEMLQTLNETSNLWDKPDCASTFSCKYGLMNYHQVAELESAWRPLIIVGMLGMTISSTMTNLDQGPIIFQAACKDALFPYLKKFFAKEYGPNKEPRRAYVFFAILTMALCLIGDLNSLNEIVTNLFMVTYALVNYACFDASFARSPGWRPAFPYYNMWISLAAAIICILVMFVISIVHSIIICVIFAITMAYFHYCSPEVNWGDTNQAHMYRNALTSLQKVTNTEIHVKNYRPQIMLMSGNPASRVPLLDFAHSITKGDSLLLAAHVIPYPANEHFFQKQTQLQQFLEQWFKHNKIKGFYLNVANQSIRSGSQSFLQTAGLGKIRPNVLMIGFKNWTKLHRENIGEIDDYVGILRDAFESNYGAGILRNGEDGFDHSEELSQLQEKDINALKRSGEAEGEEGLEDAELFGTAMHVRKMSQHHHTPSFRSMLIYVNIFG